MSRTAEGLGYPLEPGFKEPTTSKLAAQKVRPSTIELYAGILRELELSGERGLTADETAERMDKSPFLIRPRFTELGPKHLDKIEKTPERRKNESGMAASVWRIKR